MHTKTIGRAVGILYILGTVFGIVSAALTSSISSSDDVLAAVGSHQSELALGALLVLAMGLVLAMIPVVAYPILSKFNTLLSRGYLLFRSVLETVGYLLTAVAWLMLIPLSGSTEVPRVWGDTLFDMDGATEMGTIVFLIGAAMFYLILYRARLVPRWLSAWGLLAIIPYLAPVFLGLFTNVDVSTTSTTNMLLDLPLGLQEMVLAVWLIVKGFDSSRVPLQDQPAS
ncbi:MAG TPA: DUF4386 domain-containing protein [Actinomycetes bacterium]|nr:DUF4386 domain-containing protein [Actinomycetes bacterium]